MKKIIFLLLGITIFAEENFDISIGGGIGIVENRYSGEVKEFAYPFISLKYKKAFLNPNSIGYTVVDDDLAHTLSLEGFYRKSLLKKGDLDGFIENERETPLALSFLSAKRMNKSIIGIEYKREFISDGNLIDLSISRMINFKNELKIKVIPSLKFTYYDKKYSNYYFNLTEIEYEKKGEQYKNNNYTNEINGNLLLVYKVSSKMTTNLNFGVSYLDENTIIDEKNSFRFNLSTGLNYKF